MANTVQEEILRRFEAVAGQPGTTDPALIEGLRAFGTSARDLPELVGGLTEVVGQLGRTAEGQESVASIVSRAIPPGVQSVSSDGGISAGEVAKTIFKGAFGLVPLVQGIVGLFTGGGDPEPPALVKYQAPEPIRVEAGIFGGETVRADYDQAGALRAWTQSQMGSPAGDGGDRQALPEREASPAPTQVVNVTVQALDSRSFLDHSQEIAQAVREAMLNMSSINDVVSEL